MDTMDRDNSTNNVRGISISRGNKGLSRQHNTNWDHEQFTTLINYKRKEQIALKQVIDPHTNMIPTMEQVIKRPVSNHTFQDSKNQQNVQKTSGTVSMVITNAFQITTQALRITLHIGI